MGEKFPGAWLYEKAFHADAEYHKKFDLHFNINYFREQNNGFYQHKRQGRTEKILTACYKISPILDRTSRNY